MTSLLYNRTVVPLRLLLYENFKKVKTFIEYFVDIIILANKAFYIIRGLNMGARVDIFDL